MNLEQLTKTQIVLLTLLVSFMTSIATGIVTVSLIDQAPPAVTQTINRVVERTVERVVPGENAGDEGSGEVVTREVQVVVKENDLVPSAVEKIKKSIVRIYTSGSNGAKGSFLGIGFVVSDGGLIVTDGALIAPAIAYLVETADGAVYEARLKNGNALRSTALIETVNVGDARFESAALANLATVQLGQTVFTLTGKERNKVILGIVSDVLFEEGGNLDAGKIELLSTNIADSAVLFGAPLVDLFGSVVGVYTTRSGSGAEASYTPIAIVETQLAEVLQ